MTTHYQVVDKDDKPLFGVEDKSALHSVSNYHRSSHIFVETFGGKMIIQKKASSTENGGLWSSAVSGHGEMGETRAETAAREFKEELGLTIYKKDLEFITTISPIEYPQTAKEFVALFYYLLDPSKETISINEEELDAIAVISRQSLEEDMKVHRDRYSPVFVLLYDLFSALKGVRKQ